VITSGGTEANLTALACAREHRAGTDTERAVVYASDQTHSSVARAARLLGFKRSRIRALPTDERYRVRVDALIAVLERDLRDGLRPMIVVANAGIGMMSGDANEEQAFRDQIEVNLFGVWNTVQAAFRSIEGYTSEVSVAPGDTIHFHVQTEPAAESTMPDCAPA